MITPRAATVSPPRDAANPAGSLHPVALVGAGPGPLDLLTVKGLRLLQSADVVIHDHLVGTEVLAAARPGAELIFVGKRGGQFCRPQIEIEALLIAHARSGRKVVRLKGGDPLIFGRGGEEAAALAAAGLDYEIVPGVTAALAAGASTGIPLTHRDHSSAVVFLTGHENPEKAHSAVDWESYGRLDATLCVYMGVKNLPSILDRLQAGGMSPDWPAALVQSAASAEQRLLVATVGTLAAEAARQNFASPALAIIGKVVGEARSPSTLSQSTAQSTTRHALIDNGSLAPAAYLNLRRVAAELSALTGQTIAAVSWKHSDRIPAAQLDGEAAWTIGPWLRHERAAGATDFRFIPFFISPQGAIGSALRRDLDDLTAEWGGTFAFTLGLGSAIPTIVASRIETVFADQELSPATPVIVVDHGGPARESATLRNQYAEEIATRTGLSVTAASMESPEGPEFAFNRPLLAQALAALPALTTDAVIAPLFLSPGRHAGPQGDLAQIAAGRPGLRIHFAELVGTHPLAVAALATRIEPFTVRPYALV